MVLWCLEARVLRGGLAAWRRWKDLLDGEVGVLLKHIIWDFRVIPSGLFVDLLKLWCLWKLWLMLKGLLWLILDLSKSRFLNLNLLSLRLERILSRGHSPAQMLPRYAFRIESLWIVVIRVISWPNWPRWCSRIRRCLFWVIHIRLIWMPINPFIFLLLQVLSSLISLFYPHHLFGFLYLNSRQFLHLIYFCKQVFHFLPGSLLFSLSLLFGIVVFRPTHFYFEL